MTRTARIKQKRTKQTVPAGVFPRLIAAIQSGARNLVQAAIADLKAAPRNFLIGAKTHPGVFLVIAYVAAVLIYDWLTMHQYLRPSGFDWYKFSAFLVVPFLLSLPKMDWGYFGVTRWRRVDLYCLAALGAVGVVSVLLIRYFPSLRDMYHPVESGKWAYSKYMLIHLSAWLIGWEFMHRYFLLRHVSKAWPKYGWLLVPLSETLYHLQKPALECLGVALFMPILTYWTLARRNVLLAFLVHATIEIALLIYRIAG